MEEINGRQTGEMKRRQLLLEKIKGKKKGRRVRPSGVNDSLNSSVDADEEDILGNAGAIEDSQNERIQNMIEAQILAPSTPLAKAAGLVVKFPVQSSVARGAAKGRLMGLGQAARPHQLAVGIFASPSLSNDGIRQTHAHQVSLSFFATDLILVLNCAAKRGAWPRRGHPTVPRRAISSCFGPCCKTRKSSPPPSGTRS